jgi:hypothetical protein
LNFIETEHNERLSWQQCTDDELEAVGKASFCLQDLAFREISYDTEITDEATEKRTGELERLLDKNNTFQKVSAFVTNVSIHPISCFTHWAIYAHFENTQISCKLTTIIK